MSNIDDFYRKECEKIDPNCVDAYTSFTLNEDDGTTLCLDTSWGGDCIDLKEVIKAGETVTSLELSPEDDPECLKFNREDGGADCIHGDDLSKIISMAKLKDVDLGTGATNGDVLIYRNGKWYTFNLDSALGGLNNELIVLRAEIDRLKQILNYWEIPDGLPSDAKIMLGNINLYSDTGAVINSSGVATTLDKSHGIYGHSLNVDKAQDEIFG